MIRDGQAMQGAEFNEIQRIAEWRSTSVSDALFADGDIVSGGAITLTKLSASAQCDAARIYVAGAVRDVPSANVIDISMSGTVSVGVRVAVSAVTEIDDPTLNNPAVGLRGSGEAGAGRMKVAPYWSWSGAVSTDAYFPIYTMDDGVLRPKEPPPQADSITQAIAKYDIDSSGSNYIVNGCTVTAGEAPTLAQTQTYSIAEGRARVLGFPINLAASIRATFMPVPDQQAVSVEPHTSVGGTETVTTNRFPVVSVTAVHLRKTRTVTVTRGGSAGGIDTLPDATIESITSVTQGATTYHSPADFTFSGTSLNWSPSGAEPTTGSTYSVTYVYFWSGAPDSYTATSVTVSGATAGSGSILIDYVWLLPRVDTICIDKDGLVQFVRGVPAPVTPWPPRIPPTLLPLAKIYQTWDARRTIVQTGVTMVSMETLSQIQGKLDRLLMLTAQDRLNFSAQFRDSSIKKSIISDPFLDDTLRDQGSTQTAAIVDGSLVLPVYLAPSALSAISPSMLDGSVTIALAQERKTGTCKVNPYMTGTPVPATALLIPSSDYWVEQGTDFTSPVTRLATSSVSVVSGGVQATDTLSTIAITDAATIRSIDVMFELHGFAPTEEVIAVMFDSIPSPSVVAR